MSASNVVETQVAEAVAALTSALDGVYVIRETIGFGRGGVTVRARDVSTGNSVALKVAWNDPDSRARVARESDLTSKVAHPNVLPVRKLEIPDSVLVAEQPLVLGGSLGDLIDAKIPVPFARVRDILAVVAAALDEAHAAGIVHGALSPEKILMDEAGTPLITDFALRVPPRPSDRVNPRTLGAPAYMSPEQRRDGSTDGRTDQYALAVIAYELLRGERIWRLNEEGVLEIDGIDIMVHRPVAAGVPLSASMSLKRATSRDPAYRYSTVGAFVRAFAGEGSGEQLATEHTHAEEMGLTPRRSRLWLVVPIVLVTLVGLASQQPVRDEVVKVWFSDWSLFGTSRDGGNTRAGPAPARNAPTQRDASTGPATQSGAVTNTRVGSDGNPLPPTTPERSPEGAPRTQTPPLNNRPNTQSGGESRQGDTAAARTGGSGRDEGERAARSPALPGASREQPNRPTTGGIAVIVDGPLRATAVIDGQVRGETPLILEVAPGRHVVSLNGVEAFTPTSISVNVKAGDTVRASFSPRARP